MAGETVYVTKDASASNLNDGSNATTEAWETAIYGFTNVGESNTLKFGTGTYDIDRSSTYTPIPNGSSGSPTIITDNADGVVTFNHPGSGGFGFMYFTGRSPLPNYITIEATTPGNIVFDMEGQTSFGGGLYFGNSNPATSHNITIKNVHILNTADSSIYGGETGAFRVEGCVLGDQVSGGSGGGGHCIYASGPDLVITGNTIRNIRQNGIHCNPGNRTGRVFSNNLIYSTGLAGSSEQGNAIMMVNGSGTIFNNVIHTTPNGSGMFIWRTTDVTVYHNTLYSGGSAHSSPGIDINGGSGTALRTIIKNNIIIGYSGAPVMVRSPAVDTVVQWNICDGAITNASGSTTASNNTTTAVSTDEWVDPTNATLASRDFNLKAGADSIYNATTNAVPSVGIATDFAGTDRVHPDIGAYAFGTPDPPDPPVIGHLTNYPVTAWTLESIALTIFDNDGNTKDLALDGSTDGVSIEFGDTTNCTVT